MSFNSTLVRLKGRFPFICTVLASRSFNSTLVRLKVRGVTIRYRKTTNTFQFHTGSIKSATPDVQPKQLNRDPSSFNSTLVRLKVNRPPQVAEANVKG